VRPTKRADIVILNNAVMIPLNGGRFALIDLSDLHRVSMHTWTAWKGRSTYYAKTTYGPAKARKTIYLHQFILDSPGALIDHENSNGLDCRRHNLREAARKLDRYKAAGGA